MKKKRDETKKRITETPAREQLDFLIKTIRSADREFGRAARTENLAKHAMDIEAIFTLANQLGTCPMTAVLAGLGLAVLKDELAKLDAAECN